MILTDYEIERRQQMIKPFVSTQQSDGCVSYGVSSFGYDARLANNFKVFKDSTEVFDLKKDCEQEYTKVTPEDSYIIQPHEFVLGHTLEYFKIPRDVVSVCVGKSTYARAGIFINVTPLEPEWEGQVTLEIFNSTRRPVKLYCGEGICQFLFFNTDKKLSQSYADRRGKYQYQKGVTVPTIKSSV
jgi:dCTP deaminase